MDHDLRGKNVVTLGRFKASTQEELHRAIRVMGGYVRDTLRSNTHFAITAGDALPVQRARRRFARTCTFLDEAQFDALYQAHRQENPPSPEILPNQEVLTGFRELLYEPPCADTWARLVKLLDATSTALLPTAVDYALPQRERWPSPATGPHAPLPAPVDQALLDPLSLTWESPWLRYLHQGEDSPKYKMLRSLGIFGKLQSAALTRILKMPSLRGLHEIHFKGTQQKAALATYKALAHGFPRLHTLTLRHLTPRLAQELCTPGALPSLRYLTLSHSRHNPGEGELGYQALMQAPWWPRIQGVCCAMRPDTSGDLSQRNQVYQALAAHPERLTGLKHLMLGDDCDPAPLFQAGLFQGQLTRLSVSDSQLLTFSQCLDHLDASPEHSVHTLDIARTLPHYYGDLEQLPRRVDAIAQRLLQLQRPERLQELVVDPHYLSPERLAQLQQLAHEASFRLTRQSWRAPER